MHRISGPLKGYYVAAYTAPVKGGFVGYGAISATRPPDVWRPQAPADVVSSIYPGEVQALGAAEHKVRLEIDDLPPSWDPFTEPGTLNSR